MSAAVTLTCLFALQQLHVEPVPAAVGDELVVRATRAERPLAGVEIVLERPDGGRETLGVTDREGLLRHRPAAPGAYAFLARIDGVRCLVPVGVAPPRRGVWLALGSVPLGLALLWLHGRALWRRRGRAADAAGA